LNELNNTKIEKGILLAKLFKTQIGREHMKIRTYWETYIELKEIARKEGQVISHAFLQKTFNISFHKARVLMQELKYHYKYKETDEGLIFSIPEFTEWTPLNKK